MASPTIEYERLEGVSNLRVSKVITTPKGHQFRAVFSGRTITLTNVADPGRGPIVVTGGTTEASVAGFLGGLLDELADAIAGVVKLIKSLGCTPTTTTTVNVGKDGKVQSVTTTATCVPN